MLDIGKETSEKPLEVSILQGIVSVMEELRKERTCNLTYDLVAVGTLDGTYFPSLNGRFRKKKWRISSGLIQ
jgi:hypothetical protein